MKKSNLLIRTITGLIFIGVIIGIPFLGLNAFRILFLIIACLSSVELLKLVRASGAARLDALSLSLLLVAVFVTISAAAVGIDATLGICVIVVLLMAIFISQLYCKVPNPVNELAYTVFVQVYAVVPFAMIQFLAITVDSAGYVIYSPLLPLAVFAFIWANDTGAFCIGSLIGKTKLFPRISPKKSWEGAIGGVVVSLAVAYIFSICFDRLTLPEWLGLSFVVSIFGIFGDLVESMMKRAWGVKDSGNILPGHGGMLDRFDSSLFAIPAAVVYMKLLELI